MRVLFINHMGFLGGGEKSMLALMKGLEETGRYSISLMAPEGDLLDCARENGYQAFPFSFGMIRRSYDPVVWMTGLGKLISGIKQIEQVVRANKIDLVHSNSLKSALMGGIAAHRVKCPMIFHTRDFLSAGLFGKYLVGWAYHLSTKVIVNSKSVSQVYGSDPSKKVAVVYNFITPPAQLSHEKRKEIRLISGISEKQYLIGYVGRLHPDKDIRTLLEGFQVLQASVTDSRLWIVGDAMPGEEHYRSHLEQYADKLGISEKTLFLGWRNDAVELMACFDTLVVPSKKEPFGRVTVEAMMLGIPVVATASGGTLEIIDDKETGLLFDPGNSQQLAQKCLDIKNSPEKTKIMTDLAKVKVERKFSAENYIGGVQRVYDSMVGK